MARTVIAVGFALLTLAACEEGPGGNGGVSLPPINQPDPEPQPPPAPLSFFDTIPDENCYRVGTAIRTLRLPTAYGGRGTKTYSLTPTVPGLVFDAEARTVSGIPGSDAVGAHLMTYSVTDAGNNSQSLTFTISIRPVGASVYWMTEYSTGYSSSVGIHRSTLNLACWDPTVIVPDISQGYDGDYRFYGRLYVHNDKIYWVDDKPRPVHYPEPRTDRIWRADLDGTNAQVILTERISPGEITIHEGKIYWGYWNLAGTNDLHEIRRADLDGSNVETFARIDYRRAGTTIRNIIIHNGKLYWTSSV